MTTALLAHPDVAANLELFCHWIEAQLAYRGQPGLSLGIVYDQELIWARGFGYADLAQRTPATPTTLYRIASITKLFTSTAIVQLRDAGKLQLDDPITRHLPWFTIQNRFPDAPPITIRHLLTHTSGLPREAAFPYWIDNNFPAMAQIREYLPQQITALPTETKWKYSNLGLALLGEIVAMVSGQPWESYLEEHILQPLGMENTLAAVDPHHPRLATGYGRRMPDQTRAIGPYTDTNGIAPAANLASTVEDLARFAMLQLRDGPAGGNQILCGSSLREMQRVHWLSKDWQTGRGLGFHVMRLEGKTVVGHGGALQGYRTDLQLCPEDKLAVITMTNADDGLPLIYREKFFKWVAPALVKATKPKRQKSQPPAIWQTYVGKYRNVWSDTQVILRHGKLMLIDPSQPDPLLATAKLKPVGDHTFEIETDEHFASDGELAVFELDEKGKVTRLVLGNTPTFPVENW